MISRLRRSEDTGATLILVLILITVIGVVMGAVLSEADTSVRATIALRDQAGTAYAGEGAAQVAINDLRLGTFTSTRGQCPATAVGLPLNGFYPSTGRNGTSTATSAYVCGTADSGNGAEGSPTAANTSPGSALLSLDPNMSDDGISTAVDAGAVRVRGGVFSNSEIDSPTGLTNTWTPPASDPTGKTYNVARGNCDTTQVTVADPADGTTTCGYGSTPDTRGEDPGTLTPHGQSYDAPPAPSGEGKIGTCPAGTQFQTVTPGRFTDAAALSNLSGCAKHVVWFKPGTYYFDFPTADNLWEVPALDIIAGTNTIPLTTTPTPAQMPTACVPPGGPAATTSSGAEFVFGGDSRLSVNALTDPGAQLTICASNSANGPPIAIYGLKTPLGGSFPVAAQTVCPPTDPTCASISAGNSPTSTLSIQGTTYAPRAFIAIALNSNSKKIFYWGLVAYAVNFSGDASALLSDPVIDVPDTAANPTPRARITYLDVYVCPGAGPCSTSGRPKLQVKVQVSGTSSRTVTVLSWSEQR